MGSAVNKLCIDSFVMIAEKVFLSKRIFRLNDNMMIWSHSCVVYAYRSGADLAETTDERQGRWFIAVSIYQILF